MWRSVVQPIAPTTVQRPALTTNESAEKLALFKPAPIHPTHKQFEGMTVFVHIPYRQKELGFHHVNLIRSRGGIAVNDPDDPSITHMVINVPGDFEPGQTFSDEDLAHSGSTNRPEPKWKALARKFAKFHNCDIGQPDLKLNEGRTRKIYRMEWLEDVLAGRMKVTEDGPWEVWRRSYSDPEEEQEEEGEVTVTTSSLPVPPVAVDPRVRIRTPSGDLRSTPAHSSNASSPLATTTEANETRSHSSDLSSTHDSAPLASHADKRSDPDPDESPPRPCDSPLDTTVNAEIVTDDSPLTSVPTTPASVIDEAPLKRSLQEVPEPPISKRARQSLDSLATTSFFEPALFGSSAMPRAVSNPLPMKVRDVTNQAEKEPARAGTVATSSVLGIRLPTYGSSVQNENITSNVGGSPPVKTVSTDVVSVPSQVATVSPSSDAAQSTIEPRTESSSQLNLAKTSTPDAQPVTLALSTPWSAYAVSTDVASASTPVQVGASSFSSNVGSVKQAGAKIGFSAARKFGTSSVSPATLMFPSLGRLAEKSEVNSAPVRPTIDFPSVGARGSTMVAAEGDRPKAAMTKVTAFGVSSVTTVPNSSQIRKTSINVDNKTAPDQAGLNPALPLSGQFTFKSPSPSITALPRGRDQTSIKSESFGFARFSEKPASLTSKPQIDEKKETKPVEPENPGPSLPGSDQPKADRLKPRFTLRRRDPRTLPRPRGPRPLQSLIARIQRDWQDNEAMMAAARLPGDRMLFFDIVERISRGE